mmetsp:Transcript_64008/g.190752  ORF Transcript_64008/g.190752 Transcript_64008/m.190752 type:complete len:368 (+) Transcript_64008:821-1924(+)
MLVQDVERQHRLNQVQDSHYERDGNEMGAVWATDPIVHVAVLFACRWLHLVVAGMALEVLLVLAHLLAGAFRAGLVRANGGLPVRPSPCDGGSPPPQGPRHLAGAAHADLNDGQQPAEDQSTTDRWYERHEVQRVDVPVRVVDVAQQGQLLVHRRKPDGDEEVHQAEVYVYDGVAEASPWLQLLPVVPLDPMLAVPREEEACPCPQVLLEVPVGELVRVEDERREEPRDKRQPNGDPRDCEANAPVPGPSIADSACKHHEHGAGEQDHAVIVGVHSVVQVEAADRLDDPFLAGVLARGELGNERAALGGESTAGWHVGCPAVSKLVHGVVGNDLGLEHKVQRGAGPVLLEDSNEGVPEAPLHPNLCK